MKNLKNLVCCLLGSSLEKKSLESALTLEVGWVYYGMLTPQTIVIYKASEVFAEIIKKDYDSSLLGYIGDDLQYTWGTNDKTLANVLGLHVSLLKDADERHDDFLEFPEMYKRFYELPTDAYIDLEN